MAEGAGEHESFCHILSCRGNIGVPDARQRQQLEDVKTVIVFCLPAIGDTLLFTPALRMLKEALPQARITALTMLPGARTVLEHNRHIDELLFFDFQREGALRSLRYVLNLRRRCFDLSVLAYPSNRFEYNAISFLVRARIRVGHHYNHVDFVCANWLNNRTVREDDELSNLEENLKLVGLLTGGRYSNVALEFAVGKEHKTYAADWLSEHGLQGKRLVGFHPGCDTRKNHINRRWPPESFAELGRVIVRETGAHVLVFGGPEEDPLKQEVASAIGSQAVEVHTANLPQACAVIEKCVHFVSNDSALMHFATALGVPTTAIFGPTNPKWLRNPQRPRNEITLGLPCQPCFYYSPRHLRCRRYGDYRCVRQLPVEQVASAILTGLASRPEPEASRHIPKVET